MTGGADLVLRHGTALVGPELAPRPFGALLIRDGTVVELSEQDVDGGSRPEIDLAGAFVLPGLVDAHVHLDLAATPAAFEHWDRSAFVRSMTCFHNGLLAVQAGITSVRDLGSADTMTLDYGAEVASGRLLGPHVVAAGRPITMTGGHCASHGRIADGPDEVRRAVREQLAAGAGVVKLMATGGISSPGNPGLPQLGVAELRAAVEQARQAGVQVAAHAHAPEGIRNAIEAGVDTVEHAAFADEETHAALVAAGVTLVPTVSALNPIADGLGIPPATVAKSLRAREQYAEATTAAIAAGVAIAAGTDAGTAFNPIGGLVDELEMYVRFGMSRTAALSSATVAAGALLARAGDGTRRGVLEVGARADLMVTAGDPRADLGLLRRPVEVVLGGRRVNLGWVGRSLTEVEKVLEEAA